jgi:hypothetical protein
VKKLGVDPIARVVSNAVAGVEPGLMGLGPIPAVRKALARASLDVKDIDTFELNEAFAAQALACVRDLGLDPARVNPDGGAIALGHPIGCSGARVAATLVHRMKREGLRRGVASLCIGVGQGISVIEMCELIKELTGYQGEIKLDPTKPDGAAYKTVDGTLGEKMLGWKPEVPFNEGVAQAIRWYEENH